MFSVVHQSELLYSTLRLTKLQERYKINYLSYTYVYRNDTNELVLPGDACIQIFIRILSFSTFKSIRKVPGINVTLTNSLEIKMYVGVTLPFSSREYNYFPGIYKIEHHSVIAALISD